MAEPANTNADGQTPAPAAPANTPPAAPVVPQAPEAPDAAKLQAQIDNLLKHKASMEADLAKYRSKQDEELNRIKAEKDAAVQKMKETGDLAGLLNAEKEAKAALEAQLKALTPDAEFARRVREEKAAEVATAKADQSIPSYIRAALDGARDEWAASKILAEYRAAAAAAPGQKVPPPLAPAPPAPPASAPVDLTNPSTADLETLRAKDEPRWRSIVLGQNGSPTGPGFGQRLAGAFRK